MPSRICPICLTNKVRRKDIITCGGSDCLAEWRAMTSGQKARAIERAAGLAFGEIPSIDDIPLPTNLGDPDSPTKRLSTGEAEDLKAKEALDRIFNPKKGGDS